MAIKKADEVTINTECQKCNGSGCHKLTYRPFVRRWAPKPVVRRVLSRGGDKTVTYKAFRAGKIPETTR